MEYNVENLFDCRHDSLKQDEEFLPGSLRGWNHVRYGEKLENIARVILAAEIPDLVGLCEVENEYCVKGLAAHSSLRGAGYKYAMTDSPDERGIDVALLYQSDTFRHLYTQSVRIPNEEVGRRPTRDILHVAGRMVSGDTLDVFVCHLPSRSGGEKENRALPPFCCRIFAPFGRLGDGCPPESERDCHGRLQRLSFRPFDSRSGRCGETRRSGKAAHFI